MEVEHVPYIFGSFTRRRQSQHLGTPTTNQSTPQNSSIRLRPAYQHAKSKSQPEETYHPPQPSNVPPQSNRTWKTRSCLVQLPPVTPRRSGIIGLNSVSAQQTGANSVTDCFSGVTFSVNTTGAVRNSVNDSKDVQQCDEHFSKTSFGNGELAATCTLCGKIYLEPRVLNCLHTFCTRCLLELVESRRNEEEMWLPVGVYSNTSGSEASLLSTTTTTSGSTTPTNNDKDSLEGSIIDSNSLPRTKSTNRHSSNTSVSNNSNRINTHNRSNSSPNNTNPTINTNSSNSKLSNRDSNFSNVSDSGGCIICPICNKRTALSRHGVLGLSPDYVVQHRLVLSTLNDENTRLLCDLCSGDVTASHRCSDCLINLCPMCTELHHRHNNHNHELITIREVRQRGLMRIHRRIMCFVHPELEVTAYCNQCAQVVCSDCVRLYHNDHSCEPASRAAVSRAGRVQRALQKARSSTHKDRIYADQLKASKTQIEERCNKVEQQIEQWIEEYKRTIEEHRKELLNQVNKIREDQLSSIVSQQHQLEYRLQEAETSINFTETLLNEGSDIELLTFITTILKRLENCDNGSFKYLRENGKHCDDNDDVVKFLSNEQVVYPGCVRVPLYGIVTDQYVSPKMSEIRCDGVESSKVNSNCEFTIICRDDDGNQLKYGGEKLFIQIKHVHNSTIKDTDTEAKLNEEQNSIIPTQIEDKHDGTYNVKFIPHEIGAYLIDVRVRGRHIQDSPLTLHFQSTPFSACKIIRPHRGVYHCCTWCSSGGKKITDVVTGNLTDSKHLLFNGSCGCGGTMPGGYQGCGHGHLGHPGKKHWSCCGSTQEIGSTCSFRVSRNGGRVQNKTVIDKCTNNMAGVKCNIKNNETVVKGQTTKVYHITL